MIMMEQLEDTKSVIQQRLTWSIADVARMTGLSIPFLRYEVRRGNLLVKRFGRRVTVRSEELIRYLEEGSSGASRTNAQN